MKTILFVAATPLELASIKQLWKSQHSQLLRADFLITGIGNLSTTLTLTQKILSHNYDFVVNIGVCGYKDTKDDIIQIIRSVYAPTGKEILTPIFFEFAKLSSIYSSEIALYDTTLLGSELYVDMESYAVEKVCEYFKVPRLILKVPIDRIGQETINFDTKFACKTLSKNLDIGSLALKIETYLNSLPKKYDIDMYLSYYSFTVSEKIILEKYIHKYISLGKNDFSYFFETHKDKDKTLFLKLLSKEVQNYSQL